MIRRNNGWLMITLGLLLLGVGPAQAGDPALRCEQAAGKGLVRCLGRAAGAERQCFLKTGAACAAEDARLLAATDSLATQVLAACTDDDVEAIGYGPALTVASLVSRLQASCTAESSALAARTFGGPHGAVLAGASSGTRACLTKLHKEGSRLLARSTKTLDACIVRQRGGSACDTVRTAGSVADLLDRSAGKIASACGSLQNLGELIAVSGDEFLARTAAQSRCAVAMAHPDPSPLDLDCGPRDGTPAAPRGQYVQVVLDEAASGAVCGDGSPYAFWVRMAPDGKPPENVVLLMQGGGACLSDASCAAVDPGLLTAMDDVPYETGILSNDAGVSPFADWTKVYLPYCNQDLFIGGGATNVFPNITVRRSGAINVRAALAAVRDILWRELDATSSDGWRADRVRMLFGGTSAGGFGALYNYHHVLDDLQWVHSSAWPDAALALDNGGLFGVISLGQTMVSTESLGGWAGGAYLPPYCFTADCAIGPTIIAASAPRLKAEPEQQILVLSNQVDGVQAATTLFANSAAWTNAARQSFCDTRGTNGLRYYLPAITASTHVVTLRTEPYTNHPVGGVLMRDWLLQAMTTPDTLTDAVEEGTLVADIPGVNPFPCAID